MSSARCVVGGVDPVDLPDPAAAPRRARGGRLRGQPRGARQRGHRRSPTWCFPVAPVAEKSGRFVNWEGRVRALRARCCATSHALPDLRVLAGIADELGVDLGFRTVEQARAEMRSSAPGTATARRDRRRARQPLDAPRPTRAPTARSAGDLEAADRRRPDARRRRLPPGHGAHAGRAGVAGDARPRSASPPGEHVTVRRRPRLGHPAGRRSPTCPTASCGRRRRSAWSTPAGSAVRLPRSASRKEQRCMQHGHRRWRPPPRTSRGSATTPGGWSSSRPC